MDEMEQRESVVAEAKTWLNTPHHHAADIKGAGVDCGFLLIRAFHAVGLIPDIDPRPYPHDWHLHRSEEKYLEWVMKYTTKVDREPKVGDILLYKFGRCISHGAIVVDYPTIIHAYIGQGVIYADASQEYLTKRLEGVYSFWG